jgi:hypothetical protein
MKELANEARTYASCIRRADAPLLSQTVAMRLSKEPVNEDLRKACFTYPDVLCQLNFAT